MIGKTLGNYQVVGKLGAGGMGEVYRARDTRLGRDVAIKTLPPAFAQDRERLARFEREAQVLAQLNHPNIAAIHGVDESDGAPYLVLELVEGEILHGPVPVEDAGAIVRQLIDGLEEAHEKGIVHRDLKPANIKITPEGKVKILDFGLAKALAMLGDGGQGSGGGSTLSLAAMTRTGVLLGTAAYMSPEQARGKVVDKRSDIWAFGCVVYEMLTGKQAFGAETVTDSLSAIVSKEPDWSALPAATPPEMRRVLEWCLRKDPKRRLRDIGEARTLLEQPEVAPVAPSPQSPRRFLPWAVAFVAAAVAAWALLPARRPAPRPVLRFSTPLPEEGDPSRGRLVTLSPDGTRLAFLAGSPPQIYLRAMDQLEAKPVPGTENASGLFFSPDSQWLGFANAGKLKKVPVTEARRSPCATRIHFPLARAGGRTTTSSSPPAGQA